MTSPLISFLRLTTFGFAGAFKRTKITAKKSHSNAIINVQTSVQSSPPFASTFGLLPSRFLLPPHWLCSPWDPPQTLHSASSRPVTSSRSYAALRRLPSTFAQTINRWTAGHLIPSVLRLQIFFTVPECQILTFKHVFAGRVTPFLCIFAIHSTQPTSTLRL